ncbi:hypothetical protein [Xanthomonas sp. 3498]|uniref:hypothetical protein n=1 Tax=Xanthomonas sp. 3498 TaxID=2663863 RepID=UPI001612B223|nr:hypothetical protein [Xanthomonas sp. 3498]MBB5875846.1 hypothetical protein [Xanthomonas sp. 3498]
MTTITPEALERIAATAEAERERSLKAITAYGSAGVDERYRIAMQSALLAALPELLAAQPQLNYERMFVDACSALAEVSRELGCDPDQGGAEPILAAIAELRGAAQPQAEQQGADERFPKGLADAVAYADAMERAAAALFEQVIGYETDGSDTGPDMLARVAAAIAARQPTDHAPAIWVSPEQMQAHVDPARGEGGHYLPARKTPAGKFTQPLYTAPPAQVDLQALWVSVKDRLPTETDYDDSGDVLVRFRYTDTPGRAWTIGESSYLPGDPWNNGWLFGSCDYAEVSHWARKDDVLALTNSQGKAHG